MTFPIAFVNTLIRAQAVWDHRDDLLPMSITIKGYEGNCAYLEQQLKFFGRFDVELIQAIAQMRHEDGLSMFGESFLHKLQRCTFPGSLTLEQTAEGLRMTAPYLDLLASLAVLQLMDKDNGPFLNL